jgi:hypothetical protein
MKLPSTGDLIYIKRNISGVITSGVPGYDVNWHSSLTTIEPNQTAIVLKAYNPHADNKTAYLLEDPNIGVNKSMVVIVLAIGNVVVETIYSSDYMDIISSAP